MIVPVFTGAGQGGTEAARFYAGYQPDGGRAAEGRDDRPAFPFGGRSSLLRNIPLADRTSRPDGKASGVPGEAYPSRPVAAEIYTCSRNGRLRAGKRRIVSDCPVSARFTAHTGLFPAFLGTTPNRIAGTSAKRKQAARPVIRRGGLLLRPVRRTSDKGRKAGNRTGTANRSGKGKCPP